MGCGQLYQWCHSRDTKEATRQPTGTSPQEQQSRVLWIPRSGPWVMFGRKASQKAAHGAGPYSSALWRAQTLLPGSKDAPLERGRFLDCGSHGSWSISATGNTEWGVQKPRTPPAPEMAHREQETVCCCFHPLFCLLKASLPTEQWSPCNRRQGSDGPHPASSWTQ